MMKILDLGFGSPSYDLACDEALLDASDASGGDELLRFWQPKKYFVVLGYSNAWKNEVKRPVRVPILRRPSGGGTVLQGPGCLNYSLILKIKSGGPTDSIHSTNKFVMERNRQALEKLLGRQVQVEGHTDLAIAGINGHAPLLKFSGNAQRRKGKRLLFHGTFLLAFDASRMDRILKVPEKQPGYRQDRGHSDFVTNLHVSAEKVKRAMMSAWSAREKLTDIPKAHLEKLARERYSRDDWNLKF